MPRDRSAFHELQTGAAWLDLLATVGGAYGPDPVERLTGPDRLAEWLGLRGLTPVEPPVEADVVRARTLREVLRTLGRAAVVGHAPAEEAVAALDAEVAADRPPRLRVRDGRVVAAPPATAAEALARIARGAADDLTGPVAGELRACGDADCAMLYRDASGRRRWCSAQVCGVRHRVRAHRARASGTTDAP